MKNIKGFEIFVNEGFFDFLKSNTVDFTKPDKMDKQGDDSSKRFHDSYEEEEEEEYATKTFRPTNHKNRKRRYGRFRLSKNRIFW